ncbi:hypothetical protein [Bacteroides acidifaciens]|uniref:hypothetical protein n=1 Tax=Bacteroides acidifaciens TaxID=85831 RepID=UPI002675770D|nr:hypothetical protein [Bacteroides acidifaciens]
MRKEHCQCHAHNHQPPTARMLAAPLEKTGDVPKKHPSKLEYVGLAMTAENRLCV